MSLGKITAIVLGLSFAVAMNAEAKTKVDVDLNFGIVPYNDPYYGGGYGDGYGGGYGDYNGGYDQYDRPGRMIVWKCFARNRRGDLYSGKARDTRRAISLAIEACYADGSRRCSPAPERCKRVRVNRY